MIAIDRRPQLLATGLFIRLLEVSSGSDSWLPPKQVIQEGKRAKEKTPVSYNQIQTLHTVTGTPAISIA